MEKDWEIEYMYLKDVRLNYDWTHPKFLVDWLLESNFHVLLCQGIHNGMFGSWKPNDCQQEILRLQNHPGFPNGLHLQDPVLNADKFEYLCAVANLCLPSFKFPLFQNNTKVNEVMESLQQFLVTYKAYDFKGPHDFIIKAPFVQNQQGFLMKYFGTYAEFIKLLHGIYTKANPNINKNNVLSIDVFPYLIIQPRIGTKQESKVILWNGQAQFVCGSSKGLKQLKGEKELMDFAESACKQLNNRTNKAFLSDGITRVDLFCTKDGNLIVNEFESLDANYSSTESNQSKTAQLIQQYYVDILSKLINS